ETQVNITELFETKDHPFFVGRKGIRKVIFRGSVPAFAWREIGKKTTLSTPDQDSKLNLPVIGSLVYCESCALNHAATELITWDFLMDSVLLQKQVRDNADELQSYLKDLRSWGEEMKRKESELQGDSASSKVTAP
ncbi:unnamed protein product, partial [Timema podura]|nr:unnamed protein product [Timema podura]